MNSEGLLGICIKLEKLEEVDTQQTFIIEDVPDARQEVYGLELWKIQIQSLTRLGESRHWKVGEILKRKFKALYSIGIVSSFSDTEDKMKARSLKDKFLEDSF